MVLRGRVSETGIRGRKGRFLGNGAPWKYGTIVHFYPDPDIFTETTTFDDKILKNRIRELAFLNKGLELTFTDKRKETAETDVYKFEGGIKEYVAFLNEGQEVLFDEPIYVESTYNGIDVEVAM